MHLFSAIPDIEADRKAGLSTTAMVLTRSGSLVACALLWLVSLVSFSLSGSWFAGVFLVYPVFALSLLGKNAFVVERAYWYFPFINGVVGFVSFWAVLL